MVKYDDYGRRLGPPVLTAYNADGTPKYLRIYRDGDEGDCITIVYTQIKSGWQHYTAMDDLGRMSYGETEAWKPIDRPSYKHLGKRIKFADLNEDCRKSAQYDYEGYWGKLPPKEGQ